MRRKAIGYLQSDSPAPVEQKTIKAYCERAGFVLVEVLVDSHSSDHLDFDQRPEGVFLRLSRANRAKNLVAPNLYGLFRDSADAGRHLWKWSERKIRLHLLDFGGQPFVMEGELGHIFLRTAVTLGNISRKNRRERIANSLAKRKVRGRVYSSTPYGYDRDGEFLVENSVEQKTLERVKRLAKQGD